MSTWLGRLQTVLDNAVTKPEPLHAPPANHSEPCPHTRCYARPDGARLCIQCWQALEAAPVYCADGQHTAFPPHVSMPGISQCRNCPQVWSEESLP